MTATATAPTLAPPASPTAVLPGLAVRPAVIAYFAALAGWHEEQAGAGGLFRAADNASQHRLAVRRIRGEIIPILELIGDADPLFELLAPSVKDGRFLLPDDRYARAYRLEEKTRGCGMGDPWLADNWLKNWAIAVRSGGEPNSVYVHDMIGWEPKAPPAPPQSAPEVPLSRYRDVLSTLLQPVLDKRRETFERYPEAIAPRRILAAVEKLAEHIAGLAADDRCLQVLRSVCGIDGRGNLKFSARVREFKDDQAALKQLATYGAGRLSPEPAEFLRRWVASIARADGFYDENAVRSFLNGQRDTFRH